MKDYYKRARIKKHGHNGWDSLNDGNNGPKKPKRTLATRRARAVIKAETRKLAEDVKENG